MASSLFMHTIGRHLKGNQRGLEGVERRLEGSQGRLEVDVVSQNKKRKSLVHSTTLWSRAAHGIHARNCPSGTSEAAPADVDGVRV